MANDKPTIHTVSIAELSNALKVAAETHTPLLALGPPGIGKTRIFGQTAESINHQYTECVLGGRDMGHVMMPYIKPGDGLCYHYNPALPIEGNEAFDQRPIILNFDEVDKANKLMQSVLLKALDEWRIGEAKLRPDTIIVATGNRIWDQAGSEQLNAAVANRGTVVHFDPDIDFWLDWAMKSNIHPLVMAWVKFDPTNLFDFDAKAYMAGDYAFASPRSNEKLSRITHAWEQQRMSERLFRAECCGTIGMAKGIKFVGYTKMATKMPNTNLILEGKPQHHPDDPAVIYATIAALIQKATKATLGNVCIWMDGLSPEFHMLFTTALVRTKPELVATQAWSKWLVEHSSTLT